MEAGTQGPTPVVASSLAMPPQTAPEQDDCEPQTAPAVDHVADESSALAPAAQSESASTSSNASSSSSSGSGSAAPQAHGPTAVLSAPDAFAADVTVPAISTYKCDEPEKQLMDHCQPPRSRWSYPFAAERVGIFAEPVTFVVFFAALIFFECLVLSGLVPSSIIPWTSDFLIDNAKGGLVHSTYDIAAIIFSPLCGFYLIRFHKPLVLSLCMCFFGFGTVLMGLSKYFYPHPTLGGYWVLIVGQILNAFGGQTLNIIGPSYMNENISPLKLPITFTLGPAIGFVAAGLLIERWTWYNGFIVFGIAIFLTSLPVVFFPRKLNVPKEADNAAASSKSAEIPKEAMHITSLKQLLEVINLIIHNYSFLCLLVASSATQYLIGSVVTFMPTYIAEFYGVTSSQAATYMGLVVIPGAFLGGACGGYIDRRFARGEVRFKALLLAAADFTTITFFWIFFFDKLWVFMGLLAVAIFFKFIVLTPLISSVLRVLPPEQIGMGLSFLSMFGRACGSVPGPIITGSLFDQACASNDMPCTSYDKPKLRAAILGTICSCCAIVVVSGLVLYWINRAPKVDTDKYEKEESNLPDKNGDEESSPVKSDENTIIVDLTDV